MRENWLPSEWREGPLSHVVASLQSGVSVNAEDRPCGGDEIGVLRTSCVNGGIFDPTENKVVVERSEIRRAELNPRKDSILVSRMNTFDLVGESAYVDADYPNLFVPDRLWQSVMRTSNPTCVKWLSYVVRSTEFRHSVSNAATGTSGSMKNISQPSYLAISIRIPPLPQQRKIARILTTLDNVITQTEALIAKYQAIKQGLMHDLFTRGVDATGKLRPPQSEAPALYKQSELGWIPKEWEVCRVDEIGSVKLGRQRSPDQHSGKFTMPYLRVANVFDGWIDYSDVLEMDFTPTERETFSLIPQDILLNEGQSLELVGRSAMYVGEPNRYCFQNTLVRFRCTSQNDPNYWQDCFQHGRAIGRFMQIASQTTSVAHLGADRFARLTVVRPPLEEQVVIAKRIHGMNRRMRVEEQQRGKLRTLKTGLMQDLLIGRVPVKADEAGVVTVDA